MLRRGRGVYFRFSFCFSFPFSWVTITDRGKIPLCSGDLKPPLCQSYVFRDVVELSIYCMLVNSIMTRSNAFFLVLFSYSTSGASRGLLLDIAITN